MEKKKIRVEDNFFLTNKAIFGDNEEHDYDVYCEDGRAIAIPTINELSENPKAPRVLEITYPIMDVLTDKDKRSCLEYRGLYDEPIYNCNYADVCMKYGKINLIRK